MAEFEQKKLVDVFRLLPKTWVQCRQYADLLSGWGEELRKTNPARDIQLRFMRYVYSTSWSLAWSGRWEIELDCPAPRVIVFDFRERLVNEIKKAIDQLKSKAKSLFGKGIAGFGKGTVDGVEGLIDQLTAFLELGKSAPKSEAWWLHQDVTELSNCQFLTSDCSAAIEEVSSFFATMQSETMHLMKEVDSILGRSVAGALTKEDHDRVTIW